MRPYPARWLFVAALFALLVHWAAQRDPAREEISTSRHPAPVQATSPTNEVTAQNASAAAAPHLAPETTRRLSYAYAWRESMPAELAAFRDWTDRYLNAPAKSHSALETEGVLLARARRTVMRTLITRDPQRALEVTVPWTVRERLPATVQAELETRVSGTGDYGLRVFHSVTPTPGDPRGAQRRAYLAGKSYVAHVYGRRESQLAKEGASLHGVALDGELALHASPLRLLESGEQPSPRTTSQESYRVAAHGRTWEVRADDGTLEALERALLAAEDQPGPRVRPHSPYDGLPAVAAAPATPHTIGVKQVLVLRVDFPDRPGAPIAAQTVQQVMDNEVNPMISAFSYRRTSLVTTVSEKVYRLPHTATSYATPPPVYVLGQPTEVDAFHADAVDAASADFDTSKFDLVIAVCTYIGPNASNGMSPFSHFNFAGIALLVGGSKVVINGGFPAHVVAHELGHCFGLMHSNLWQVSDRNPVSSSGTTVEYGDPFDMMNSEAHSFGKPGIRHHFNVWHKNRLGWLPDSAVTTVTRSGTYRIHRFDTADASSSEPLALRVFRDGVRWYWIGFRGSFSADSAVNPGATIVWGFNNLQQSQLLDLKTPGSNALDAALEVGATLTDSESGTTFKVLQRGGGGAAEWLDVQVTLPEQTPNRVAAWGADGALFFEKNTGRVPNPVPEVYVPFDAHDTHALVAADRVILALRKDKTVRTWGGSFTGHVVVPEALTDVVSIASTSGIHGVARGDGTVHLWTGSSGYANILTVPPGLGGVRQLALGGGSYGQNHVVVLKADRTVAAWGDNIFGQTNVPAGLRDVVAVAAGDRFSVALKADGTVVHWGANYTGVSFPEGLMDVVALATHGPGQHALALKADGTVVAWGSDSGGQSRPPAGLRDVVQIAAGAHHSLALQADGTVVGWGHNGSGQLAVPASLPPAYGIAAGGRSSFALVGSGVRITAQPRAKTLVEGSRATLTVSAAATGPLTYQWRKDGLPVAGATQATLALPNSHASDNGYYDVIVSGGGTTATSAPSRVLVYPPLAITTAPISQSFDWGADVTLTVGTTGGGPLRYQWRRDGVPIDGATGATLTMRNIPLDQGGRYEVTVTDGASTLTTAPAEITVAPISRIANLSVRTRAGPGQQALTIGFVIGRGNPFARKDVLVRAVGPSLTSLGVAGVIADPQLSVFNAAGFALGGNDNWGGDSQIADATVRVGAFPLSNAQSRDAARYLGSYPPSAYRVEIGGVAGSSGVVLAEIYDANDLSTFNAPAQRLVNLSARAPVGTGDAILFAGFNIVSAAPKTILIRGIGPALREFGVTDALSDPKIELFNGSSAKLMENDDWGGATALMTAFSAVGAFALDSRSKDAALLATLPAGSYTIHVSGVGGLTGTALIEIYDLP